ncbi:MAG: recombinase family protein [Flexilinea sp.]|nr:recombinase family protein [Flexilinea sp.]
MIPNVSPFQRGDKVVAYCRYSEGDEQGLKNQSTEEQAQAIRAFCNQNGLELVRIFADPFASGRSVAKRDHYLEMLSYLLKGKKRVDGIAGLVVWDWERYGRNFDQAQLDAARLRMAGYKLFSLQQPIIDEGPFARVLEAMYFASAQNQSDMISADVKRALQNNFTKWKVIPRSCIGFGFKPEPVDMGLYTNGTPRIGYRSIPDPEIMPRIREAVSARLHGASSSKCRDILGAPSNLDVKRLFAKTQLYGAFSYGGQTIEDYSEPIIDRETFDALQAFEASHTRKHVGRQGGWSANPPMLSGLLYCGECGNPMYICRRKSKGRLYSTYRCRDKECFPGVRQDLIEPFVIRQCEEILTAENARKWIDGLVDADSTEAERNALENAEKELSAIEKRISNAVDLLLDNPSEALTARLAEMEARRKELQERIRKLTERDSAGFDADVLYQSTLELSTRILAVLRSPDASDDLKRTVLASFVRSIVVSADHIVIINYIPPGFPAEVAPRSDSDLPSTEMKNGEVAPQPSRFFKAPPEGVEPPTS